MNLRIFLPITKVDAVNRTVYGKFTEEKGDRSGEIMDYSTSKPLFSKWSEDMYGASGGKNFGNIRAMHKNVAAGMVCQPLDFDDNGRSIGGLARIVDEDEWRKVEEGVYTGFSVGGRYVKRWTDRDNPHLIRYTAEPNEVSLVDLPCVPGSTFQFVKSDGHEEVRPFSTTSSVAADPVPLLSDPPDGLQKNVPECTTEVSGNTAAGTDTRTSEKTNTRRAPGIPDNGGDPASPTMVDPGEKNKDEEIGHQDSASPPGNVRKGEADAPTGEVEQVWKAKDGTTFTRKADAIKHNQQLDVDSAVSKASETAHEAVDSLRELLLGKSDVAGHGDPSSMPPTKGTTTSVPIRHNREGGNDASVTATAVREQGGDKTEVSKSDLIVKDLYDIGRVASIIGELRWIKTDLALEDQLEQDASTAQTDAAQKALETLCEFLTIMVKEEVDEIMSNADVQLDGGTSVPVLEIVANAAGMMNIDFRKALRAVEGLPEAFADELSKAGNKLTEAQMMHLQSAHDHVAAASGGDACNGGDDGDMGKLNAAAKERLQTVHDHLGALGTTCKAAKLAFGPHVHSPLKKRLEDLNDDDLTLDNPNLPPSVLKLLGKTNGMEFQLGKLGTTVSDLIKEVKKLKDQPMPGKGVRTYTAVAKGQDVGSQGGNGQLSPDDQAVVAAYYDRLGKMDETQRAKELIKMSLAQPVFRMD